MTRNVLSVVLGIGISLGFADVSFAQRGGGHGGGHGGGFVVRHGGGFGGGIRRCHWRASVQMGRQGSA